MKVVVTGGAGFIGSHFARALLTDQTNKYEVIVLDSLTYAGNIKNLEDLRQYSGFHFIQDDICNPALSKEIFKNCSAVVNLAAESHVDRSIKSSTEFIRTNIQGTHNLLQLSLNFDVPKFIQVSTDEVYGSISKGSWDEDFPLQPNSPYAASKASADLLVRSFNKTYNMHTNITRCSNNFGTHQYPEKFIPVVIRSILAKQKIPIYGSGLNRRDWLHVSDHCRAIQSVMLGGDPGEIYNVGGGAELSNVDLAKEILGYMGEDEDLLSFVSDRKGHDQRYSVSYEKIKSHLGYEPSTTLNDSLKGVITWYQQNPNWWK